MQGQIPKEINYFLQVMCASTGADVSPAPSIKQSVVVSGCGRGRSHSRDFGGGRSSFGGGCGSYGGRQIGLDKELRQCKHYKRNNHISEKC